MPVLASALEPVDGHDVWAMVLNPPRASSATAGDCWGDCDWDCDCVVEVVAAVVGGVVCAVVVVGHDVWALAAEPDSTRADPARTATPRARRRFSLVFNRTPFR